MPSYDTLKLEGYETYLSITIHRPQARNSLNQQLIDELNHALDFAKENALYKVVILKGENGVFCTGMDLYEAIEYSQEDEERKQEWNANYMNLLKRITAFPKVIISLIEGKVLAGGVGIVAASDLVIANLDAQFALSEALWGLLPCMVLPYLIRRVGYQCAYRMALTTETLNANEAKIIHLVDIATEDTQQAISRLLQRIVRLQSQTIVDLKHYFQQYCPITDTQERVAIHETARLSSEPRVMNNITNYLHLNQFPWETNES